MAHVKFQESDWLAATTLPQVFTRQPDRAKDCRLKRLFAVACIRPVMKRLPPAPRLQGVFDATESFAEGSLTRTQVAQIRKTIKTAQRALGPVTNNRAEVNVGPVEEATYEILRALDCATVPTLSLWLSAEFAQQAVAAFARPAWRDACDRAALDHVALARDIFGNPFRPVAFDPAWRCADATGIAARMYDSRDFSAMPVFADALEEAGCTHPDILLHCREPGVHVRGCWVVDLVLGKS